MNIQIIKKLLLVAATLYFILYVLITFVVLLTSGLEVIATGKGLYSVIVPMGYSFFCLCITSSFSNIELNKQIMFGIGLSMIAIPSVWFSLMGLGMYLPILMLLWVIYTYCLYNNRISRQ